MVLQPLAKEATVEIGFASTLAQSFFLSCEGPPFRVEPKSMRTALPVVNPFF